MLCGQRVRPPWLLLLLTLVCNGSFPKKKKKKKKKRSVPPMAIASLASPPPKFSGKDDKMPWKSWTKLAEQFLAARGQNPRVHVVTAAAWLVDEPARHAMLLFQERPADEWDFHEWVNAMNRKLFQLTRLQQPERGCTLPS